MTAAGYNAPVTAIVPCYRCADTVERALDSILAQTWQVSEIILVDDASGDGTHEKLLDLQKKKNDRRIRIVGLTVNSGPGGARNAAWDVATQPWLAFLDADDVWSLRKIELQYSWLMNRDDVDLCAHNTALWSGAGVEPSRGPLCARRLSPSRQLYKNEIPTRSVMLKRALPFRFPARQQSEDYALWLRMAFSGYSCWKLSSSLAYSFRPDFSPGGYSSALWSHEKWELKNYLQLKSDKRIGWFYYFSASVFSLAKFVRRCLWVWVPISVNR
jgi:glycosyltransferase involved in cell wall biosynthesis